MISISSVFESVQSVYGVRPGIFLGKSRMLKNAQARRAAISLMRESGHSRQTVEECFKCCGSNVRHAVITMRDQFDSYPHEAANYNRARVLAGLEPGAEIGRVR